MINWVIDNLSNVWIGPLNESECSHVQKVLDSHENKYTVSNYFLSTPSTLVCSYDEFVDQIKETK